MENSTKILEVKNLSVSFDKNLVLKDINFSVPANDILAIVGPNGAGKSVLLRTLLGIHPHIGQITWHGNTKISYIPQHLSIEKDLPLTVKEFFLFKESNLDKIDQSLSLVGVAATEHPLLNQQLGLLSGGQLQRVLIAWSLIDNPNVLLYDEPTSGIDVGGEETIYNLLSRLHKQKNLTILLVSHDLNIVYKYASSVLCLDKNMVCHGSPREVLDPQALAKLYGGQAGFYQHQHE